MEKRNYHLKLEYLSLSLLLMFSIFSPVQSAFPIPGKSCHYSCLHNLDKIKNGAAGQRKKLKDCEYGCETAKSVQQQRMY